MNSRIFIAALVLLGGAFKLSAATYNEAGGLVIMEMENTASPLDLWQAQSSLSGYTGSGYLQFLGNTFASGPATSPLEFTFKVNQAGLYYLHLHCAKEIHDGRNDVANDCYVRVEGDYNAGPGPYDSHGDNASLSLLQSDTKYFGGAVDSWKWENGQDSSGGAGNLDPGGHANKRVAVYDFKAGETYTLVVSGRSKFFRINRIMFRHTSVAKSTAQNLSNPESGFVPATADYIYDATEDFPSYLSGDVPYYIDNGNDVLAIAANIESNRIGFAQASRTFDGTTGSYDVTLTTLTEEDGESTYRLLVNGSVEGTFENTYVGPGSPQDLQPETQTWIGIAIQNGDTIAIESNADTNGEIPEGGGTAWARGRWRQIELNSSLVKPPAGRLAYVADGNSPDPDDIGANAVVFGLLAGSELQDRLVHFSHSCDLVKASTISAADELRRQSYLHQTVGEGIAHFGPFNNLANYYNCRSNQTEAVSNLTAAIDASSASDPLWIIEAGEPDIIGYALQAADPAKIPHVHVVSHHPANDDSGDYFTWAQILAFGVTEHQIGDQNVGLQVLISSGLWDWAETHPDPAMVWILDQLKYAEQDGVVGFQTGKYDCSDAGMIYWWLTGASSGGNSNATPVEIRDMLLYEGATCSAATITLVALGSPVDWTAGSSWSDGQPAHSGADYNVPATGNLRSENGTSSFPGESLTVLADGKFQVRSNGGLGETTTVGNLVLSNGTSFAAGEFAQLAAGTGNDLENVLAGALVNSGYTKFLSYHAYSGGTLSRSLKVLSSIGGSGHIQAAEGSAGFGGENVVIDNAANTFSGTWEVGTDSTLVFNNAGAVGAADIEMLGSGTLQISGDWNAYATLTVADTASTSVELGAYNWTVADLAFGGTLVSNGTYSAAALNALGTNGVFSGSGTISVSAPPTPALIAGWDTWSSGSAPVASVTASNVTASAITTTEGLAWHVNDGRGASNDGDWGTFAGPPAASTVAGDGVTGENLELSNATTGGTITFTIANNGSADIVLDTFHFDAYAFRTKAARTYTLSVLAGSDITVGPIYISGAQEITQVNGAWDSGAHDDIDHALTGLADHTLGAGESVQFLLAFSGGAGDSSGGHDLWVDNVALSQISTTPPVDAPQVNADSDITVTLPGNQADLIGSATDNGTIVSYLWTQLSGPTTASLTGETNATASAGDLVEGTYTFRLTVTDDESNQATDDAIVSVVTPGGGSVVFSGELKQWHKVTLMMDGPSTSETATPNPFTDYRMNVTFTHPGSGLSYVVPGYFAADGDAANTGATSGNTWVAHLSPDHAGTWDYTVSFRTGTDVAMNSGVSAGTAVTPYDHTTGSFTIAATDKTGRDHRGKGRLTYVDKHHLQYAGTGEYFLKAGTDAPENLLAYDDFDATPNDMNNQPNLRKSWSPHAGDYDAADAAAYTWNGGKGTELLGAINYLSEKGINVFSFLTFSLDGDDDNVFPHLLKGSVANYESVADNARWANATNGVHHDRFDVSKMAQWENIFAYGDKKGMYLHFKTQETENDQRMDGGALGRERKIYYRELVARYGHHLALNWNLGEENTNTEAQEKAFAQWFHDNDPYRHNVVLHTYPAAKAAKYTPLLGAASKLTGLSLQTNQDDFSLVFPDTLTWVQNSASAGKPWVVAIDEPGDAQHALRPAGDEANSWVDGRINAMWGNIMAGGAGVEFYYGYQHAHSDLTCQDFRSRDGFWDYCRYMLNFFADNNVPFWDMANEDALVSNANAWCLRKPGESFVVYLKTGGTTTLNLSGAAGTFDVRWFDPRNGGVLQNGSVSSVSGGSTVSLGQAPSSTTSDWVVLVQVPGANTPPTISAIDDQTIVAGTSTDPLAFTIGDSHTAASALVLTPTSSDTGLVPLSNIVFGGSGASRTVTVAPAASQDGDAVIGIIVSDDAFSTTNTFLLTVLPEGTVFGSVTNNTPGTVTWVCPSGVTSIEVECWGGGGAGGAVEAVGTANVGGGGGAGGAYARKANVSVTPGNSYDLTIPAAATAPVGSADGARFDGADVSFVGDSSETVTAAGGQGGECRIGSGNISGAGGIGSTAGCIGDVVYAGGNGVQNGDRNGGAGGGGAGELAPGGDASGSTAGVGGGNGGGNGGAGRSGHHTGQPGQHPGGGGGGAKSQSSQGGAALYGGIGGLGQIIVCYAQLPAVVPPILDSSMNGGDLEFTWTGSGFKVQCSTNLVLGSWVDVPVGETPPVNISPSHPEDFFRLIEQ